MVRLYFKTDTTWVNWWNESERNLPLFPDTELNFNETFYNGSIGDHWSVDQAVLTFTMTGIDYAETANITLTPENATLDYFYVDGFGMYRICDSFIYCISRNIRWYFLSRFRGCKGLRVY